MSAAAIPAIRAPAGKTMARALLAGTAGLTLLGWTLLALSFNAPVPNAWGFRGFAGIFALSFGWIGYLLATRRGRNPIGWVFLCSAILGAAQVGATEYASYALFGAGQGLPGGVFGAWLNDWIWLLAVSLVTVPVFVYFPDGKLLSERWRPILGVALVSTSVSAVLLATTPGPLQTFGVTNPFGVDVLSGSRESGSIGGRAVAAPTLVAMTIVAITIAAAALSSVLRFRRSSGIERQQLKWFASASVLCAVAITASFVSSEKWVQVALIFAMTTVPIAIGIAILRYRLYDIDTIINRAIVYGALTAILAGLYSASIGLFQRLFSTITGERSDAAIVVTTLILASAFTPVKQWLQAATDRRFKAPPDARKRLEAYRESLRVVAEAVDRAALCRRFLEETSAAFRCRGASLVLARGGHSHFERVGDALTGPVVRCDLEVDGVRLGHLELGPRVDDSGYAAADLAELEKTAAVVARTYVLAERLALERNPESERS